MFRGGGVGEEGGGAGVPIRLVVHLYKEQRIIIDLFMDRQNRWRPIEMRQAGRLYISAWILAMWRDSQKQVASQQPQQAAAAPLGFCSPERYRTKNSLKTKTCK